MLPEAIKQGADARGGAHSQTLRDQPLETEEVAFIAAASSTFSGADLRRGRASKFVPCSDLGKDARSHDGSD